MNKEEHKLSLEFYNKGLSDKQISIALKNLGYNFTKDAVCSWRKRNNLPLHNKLDKNEHNERLKLYNSGLSDNNIAKKFNVKRGVIYRWRSKNNLESKRKKSVINKYDYNIPEYILLEAINTGKSNKEIADTFGVPTFYIRTVMRRNSIKAWKYGKQCVYCGELFVTKNHNQKRCTECATFKRDHYGDVKAMRKDFFNLLKSNPEKAMKLKEDMREEEGFKFMDYALDGICPEKIYETYGYTILKENGGVLFEINREIKDKDDKKLTSQEIRYIKDSYIDKIYTVYRYVHGTKYGTDFIVYYINPFECVEAIIEKYSGYYDDKKLISMCQKIYKQHSDYVLFEVENKDGEYYKWNETKKYFTLRQNIFKEFMERLEDE